MMGRLAVNCTLRSWALAATMEDTNPVYDITLVGQGLSGLLGQGALCSAESWWFGQQDHLLHSP